MHPSAKTVELRSIPFTSTFKVAKLARSLSTTRGRHCTSTAAASMAVWSDSCGPVGTASYPASASSSFEVGTDPSSSSAVVAGAFGLVVAAAAGSSDQGAFDQVALAFALDLVASSALVGSFAVG